MIIRHFTLFLIRFNVAIKSPVCDHGLCIAGNNKNSLGKCEEGHITALLDEAKTMASVNGYHENIVNLQGITFEGDLLAPQKVCKIHPSIALSHSYCFVFVHHIYENCPIAFSSCLRNLA